MLKRSHKSATSRFQQGFFTKGFWREIDRSGPHRFGQRSRIFASGNENDWNRAVLAEAKPIFKRANHVIFHILLLYKVSKNGSCHSATFRFGAVFGIDPEEPQTIPAVIGKRDSMKKRLKEIIARH
jgi:hypothetical protein